MSWLKQILCLFAVLLLSACATQPGSGPKTPELPKQSLSEVQRLLAQAEQSPTPQRELLQLQAGSLLIEQHRDNEAKNLLQQINAASLPTDVLSQYDLVQAQLALYNRDTPLVFNWLERPEVINNETQEVTVKAGLIKAEAFILNGEYRAAIDEVELLEPSLSDQQKPKAYELLWSALIKTDNSTIEAIDSSASQQLKGWIALANIFRNVNDIGIQLNRYEQWERDWPNHPATIYQPAAVKYLQSSAAERPQHIALLLPESGPLSSAGKAIQEGFMAAYFMARKNSADVPEIKFYDSSKGDIATLVNQVSVDGAQMIIGPLDREKVLQLQQLQHIPVPILALNYGQQDIAPNGPLYQFGLATEDEAAQAAERAWLDGYRRAAILTSADDKGQRVAEAFRKSWYQLGGVVAAEKDYASRDGFKNLVADLLQVNQSEARARRIRQLLGKVEFTPRRRQDIDFIFLYANPTNARLLKPMLAYQFAGNIPVFATSSVYQGQPNPAQDNDLNGIRFVLPPWLAGNSTLKQTITKAWPQSGSGSYSLLYALGADAWKLYPYLNELGEAHSSQLYGNTGVLQLDSQHRVHRELNWLWFKNGIAQPLPSLSAQNR